MLTGSGIYTTKGSAAFDAAGFQKDPSNFWSAVRPIVGGVADGTIMPSLAHRFTALLHQKGCLRRLYTQNIDTLHQRAGVPEDKIVEAHGSLAKASCTACHHAADMDTVWSVLKLDDTNTPMCTQCGAGVFQPDVVFFGMPLPRRYEELSADDFGGADCLIVMGTSLVVYPFAGTHRLPRLTAASYAAHCRSH